MNSSHEIKATVEGVFIKDGATMEKPRILSWLICALAACFYIYEFVIQVSPGIMTSELMRDLKINAIGLGTLSAFYYYAYMPMQIPAGMLYDHFGPRRVLPCAIVVCALGAFLFGHMHSVYTGSLARLFTGAGSAFSFIGGMLLISRWFPLRYFPILAGVLQLLSSVGAIAGEAPLAALVAHYGWRTIIIDIAYVGFALAFLCALFIRDYPANQRESRALRRARENPFKMLALVVRSRQTWLIGLYGFASWAPILVFASLWGVPFLVQDYHVSTTVASLACSMVWIGAGVGCPLGGAWSNQLNRRCPPLTLAAVIALISLLIILYVPHLPFILMYICLFIFGLSSAGQSLSFVLVADNNRPSQVGTAIGFNNMTVVAGGAIFQPIVGWLLHTNWSGKMLDGAPIYSANDYRIALCLLPICSLIAIILSTKFIRESFCKPTYNTH